MTKLRWNWPAWAGLLLSILGFVSYFVVFARFPLTRNVPWANFLLFGAAVLLVVTGLKRAFTGRGSLGGKVGKLRLGASELVHSRRLLLHGLSRDPAVASVAWGSNGGTESPRLHSAQYAQQPGFPFRASLYADLTRFLRIAIGLATALGQVHRHGLIRLLPPIPWSGPTAKLHASELTCPTF